MKKKLLKHVKYTKIQIQKEWKKIQLDKTKEMPHILELLNNILNKTQD